MDSSLIAPVVGSLFLLIGTIYTARVAIGNRATINQETLQTRLDSFGERLERFGIRMDTYGDNQDYLRQDVRKLHDCLDDVQKDVKNILAKLSGTMTITLDEITPLDDPPKG